MRNKVMKKIWIMLLTATMFISTGSMTAFAQANETPQQTEQVVEEQPVDKPEEQPQNEGTPFSTPGNGELVDDKENDSTKQFLTVQTKNGNTFYMVIDRSGTSENVYMLSLVDENDLSEFLDDSKKNEKEEPRVVLPETEVKPETETKPEAEMKPEKNQKDPMAGYLVLGGAGLLALGGATVYGMKKIRKKKEEEIVEEGLEFAEDTYINEDEEVSREKKN